jgi:nucleotide-binding universal stress UspA family protein
MDNKIIVGHNGTASSTEAVMWAANEAVVRRQPLRIVACYDVPAAAVGASMGYGAGEAIAAAREVAESGAIEIESAVTAAFPGLVATVRLSPAPAASALLDGADAGDLIIVGSSSHEGASAFWMGTTPRQLVRHSPCPVVVVRGAASRNRPDRLVIGIDNSPASDRALAWAGDEADRHGVELVVVHGWSYAYMTTSLGVDQARELTQIDAACALDRSVELARDRNGTTVTGVLVEDSPVSALLDTVRDGDVLVIGSRGHGGFRSRLFGSTANSILDSCQVPVVVLRAEPTLAGASSAAQAELARS